MNISWKTGTPDKHGIYYLTAVKYPTGIVYEILPWVHSPGDGYYWGIYRSQIGRVVAFIRLGDVLKELTGSEMPDPDSASVQAILTWSTTEPPKDRPILAAFAPEYDILEWDEEFGWPDFMTSLLGYLDISELLTCVEEQLPYREQ